MNQGPLHSEILERWGADIAAGRRPVGRRVSIEEAAAEHGVSRSVIREVVRVLESLGMVETRQRVGVTVLPSTSWSPFDERVLRWRLDGPERAALLRTLSELRAAIEPAAARLAAQHATPEQCGALAAAYVGMASTSRAADADEYLSCDIAFHRTLLEASGNEMFASLGAIVVAVLEGRTHHELMPTVANTEALRLHAEVAAAVRTGDAAAAEACARAIVEEARDAMLRE
ncbi:FadR/GntR family transcriptional regulator [Leucobacter sp.]